MQDMANDLKDKHLLVKSMLGRGGFAKVYLGTWRGLDVAVKVVDFRCASSGNDQLQTRTLTEAAICANVQHTNIVSTYSYDLRPAGQFAPELHLSMPKDGNSSWPGPFQYTGHVETWQLLLVQVGAGSKALALD